MTFDQQVSLWTAIGTVGAVIVALVLGAVAEFRTRKDRKIARAREEARETAERRAQAYQVAIWTAPLSRWAEPGQVQTVSIRNSSTLPVFDVEIPYFVTRNLDGDEHVAPTTFGLSALIPGETAELPLDDEEWNANDRFQVYFRDARGAYWRRDLDGTLTEGATVYEDWDGLVGTPPTSRFQKRSPWDD